MTTRRHLLIAPLIALVIGLAAGPVAHASSGSPVIADCTKHLRLTHSYTVAQLQNALATLPADIAEYSNCKDVINRALLVAEGRSSGGSGGSGGGGGGSALPTPVIVVLVVLALGAVTLGAVSIRRRRGPAGPSA